MDTGRRTDTGFVKQMTTAGKRENHKLCKHTHLVIDGRRSCLPENHDIAFTRGVRQCERRSVTNGTVC